MRSISVLIILTFFIISCKKKKQDEPIVDETPSNGLIVLCEGLFQQNNSTVSWIDLSSGEISNNMFFQKAQRDLGDTGNDLLRYGGKIYIAVNVSSIVEVMDASSFEEINHVHMEVNNVSKQPRFMVGHGPNVYVTCYDGYVDVLDTTSLTITQRIAVGSNPEGIAVANNKLYVANSGGLNYPVMDSTVSVIDLTTKTELTKITVGLNPGDIEVDDNGDVYVISRGDYGSVPSRMVRINSQTDAVEHEYTFDASEISRFGTGYFLISYADFSTGANHVGLFNTSSETLESGDYMSMAGINTVYEVVYIPATDKIYVLDAMDFSTTGYVREFSSSGAYLKSYHVGLNPTDLLFQ